MGLTFEDAQRHLTLGCETYRRKYVAVGYRDRERTPLTIRADDRRHALRIGKKAGYEVVAINEVGGEA